MGLLVGAAAQTPASLGGVWVLNRAASTAPHEIGFNADWLQSAGRGSTDTGSPGGSRRGRRGGGGGSGNAGSGAFPMPLESSDTARVAQFLTGEARNPPTRLMIVDTPGAITITNELGQSRTLHPTGREESMEVGGVTLDVTTRRDGGKVVVTYTVDKERQVQYTYTPGAPLLVDVQFVQRGGGDKAQFVYDTAAATETRTAGGEPAAAPSGGATPPAQPAAPIAPGTDMRPGAELRGLKSIGILVEDLGPQARSCGLSHDALESALAKKLTDGGFSVHRNSDEDTYLYVNVQTSTVSGGLCVSRYDAFLYTHATATLTYREQPALVQVSLIHRGGIGSSVPGAHAPAVTHALEDYVDVMITQIRDANR
ncbi:MAG TPA: hypothetical protein VFA27_16850 [Vicinamibacterales bacterium]|nr:hypothetical protein [Vicinamibacterales bacterium]